MQAANVNIGMNLESAGFVSGSEQARRSFVSNMDGIRRESDRTAAALGKLPNSLKGLGSANDNLKSFGNKVQQVGYQVGDFATQIAGGGSALTAFIQQGTQVAGAFGPMGAVIGAVGAVVGVLARSMLDWGNEAETAQTKLDKLNKSTNEYKAAMERALPIQKAMLENQISISAAMERDAVATAKATGEVVRLRNERDTLNRMQVGNPFIVPQQVPASIGNALGNQQPRTGVSFGGAGDIGPITREALRKAAENLERAKQLIKDQNDTIAIGKAQFKPGLEARDYYEAEQAAAKAANDTRIADAERAQKELIQLEKERFDYNAENIRAEVELFEKGQQEKQEAFRNLVESAASAINKRDTASGRAAEAESQRLSEIYSQPFKDLATNLSATLSSGIQDALSGDFDFTTLAEGFGDIFADTLAASITAALTPALNSAADSFGDAMTSALKSSTAAGGGGTAGGAPGLTYGGAALGGAAFGGIAGGLFGAYGPGMKPGNYAGIGGALGGGLGAGIGFGFGGVPGALVGGGIGSLLGSVTGGLFGGQNNLGNDRSAQAYRSGRGITYSDTSFSQENRDITAGILTEISALEEAFTDLGGVVGDVKLRIEAGNKSGITVDGRKFATAEDALAASISKLIGSTTGLTASQQTVLANTKGGSAAEIGADLQIAAQFDQITATGTELEKQLASLATEMASFGAKAQALGLDINAVAAAHQKEAQALIDARTAEQNAIRAAIDAFAPSGNTLDIALAQLNDQVQELAKAAIAADVPIENLAATHQRAAAQLIAANAQLQQSLALQVSALDPGTDQLSLALAQLNQQVQELATQITASGGTLDALAGAHQRAAADIVNQFQERQRLERQQAEDEQRRLQQQIKAQQEQARAEAAARQAQITDFQARVTLLEADPLSAIVIGIRENIRQIIEQGRALGLTAQSEREIRAAGNRLEAAARKDFTDSLNEQIRNYQTQVALLEASPLDAALLQIRERFNELITEGKKIGLTPTSEAQLRAAQTRAEATARNRFKLDQDAFTLQLRGMGAASNDATLLTAELALQFKELTLRATELGIPLSEVTAAQARATQALQERLELERTQVQDQIARAGGSDTLADRLRQLDVEMRELARSAAGVGIPLSAVTAAHVKAAQRIRDEWAEMLADMLRQQRDATQGILEAQRSAAGAIDQFLNPFKEALSSRGIGQGVYAGATLAQSGLKEFREALTKARTGDTGALSALVGIGQGAIAQARQTYGSTKAFADIFREIEAGFREQQGVLEAKREELLSQIGTFTRETVNEIIKLRVQAIGDLRADLAKLSRDIVVAVEGGN